jgi:uncharacterized protein YeeX (DUF496 family)
MKIEVLKRVALLSNPQLQILIDNLKVEEVDYFIEHLTLDIGRSIHNWYLKSAENN